MVFLYLKASYVEAEKFLEKAIEESDSNVNCSAAQADKTNDRPQLRPKLRKITFDVDWDNEEFDGPLTFTELSPLKVSSQTMWDKLIRKSTRLVSFVIHDANAVYEIVY